MRVPDGVSETTAVPALDVWVVGVHGDHPTRLTFGPRNAFNPVWSPDGSRIAFTNDLPDGTDRIALVDPLHPGAITELTEGASIFGSAWSRDGLAIAFQGAGLDNPLDVVALTDPRTVVTVATKVDTVCGASWGGAGAPPPIATPTLVSLPPADAGFQRTGSMMIGRARHGATLLADGRVLVEGGDGVAPEIS